MSCRLGTTQRKILLLLESGLALGLSRSPRRHFKIVQLVGKEWRQLNRQALWRSIRSLYVSKLIEEKLQENGSVVMILSEEGKKRTVQYKIDEMKIKKPKIWNKKWCFVTFDVPEHQKKVREALRFYFRKIGLRKFQKSMFLTPYSCYDEIDFIVEYFQARAYVRMINADSFDNELHWKVTFNLPIK